MEQNIKGKEAPTQHTIDNDWNGELNQTLEQALQSEQFQKSFQQLHKFNGAQPIQIGELPSVGESNPVQTGQAHNSNKPFEYLHPQRQMPGKDKHRPWDSSVFTHAISDNTDMNSSECEEPTPRQNRGSGCTASSRNNPLAIGRDDNNSNKQKRDPSYQLGPLGRYRSSSKRPPDLRDQAQPTLNTFQSSGVHQLTEQSTIWSNSLQAEPVSQMTQVGGWMNH
jgi:hypothetical protein